MPASYSAAFLQYHCLIQNRSKRSNIPQQHILILTWSAFAILYGESGVSPHFHSTMNKTALSRRHRAYQSRQIGGTVDTLSNPTSAHTGFIAPSISKGSVSMVFELQVTNTGGGLSATESLSATMADNGNDKWDGSSVDGLYQFGTDGDLPVTGQ